MILCLLQLVKDKNGANLGSDECEEWTDLIDRGDSSILKKQLFNCFLP